MGRPKIRPPGYRTHLDAPTDFKISLERKKVEGGFDSLMEMLDFFSKSPEWASFSLKKRK